MFSSSGTLIHPSPSHIFILVTSQSPPSPCSFTSLVLCRTFIYVSFSPSETLPLRDRCFLVAKILKHQLRFPNLSSIRTWNRERFVEMLSVVPNDLYEADTLDFIWPGPDIPLFHPPPSQHPKFAPVLSGEHLVTAGLDIAQNVFNGRWLGPFLPSKKLLRVHAIDGRTFINPPNFLPYFFVPKPSGPPRWISDAARPVENWEQHQPSPSKE